MKYLRIKEMLPLKPAEGVEIRALSGEKLTLACFALKKGAGVPEHAHPHEQIGMVLKGSVRLTVEGETRVMEAGDAYQVPSNAVHSGQALGEGAEIVEVFSPPREDLAPTT